MTEASSAPLSAREHWALGAILVVGAGLRVFPASWMSYFGDEVYSLRTALTGAGGAWSSAGSDIHPPLFNLLLALWLPVSGVLPEWRARILPIAIGLLWVVATHRLARLSLPPRGALVAAAVVAIHPMAVLFTEPVRWYGLFALVGTMVVDALQRSLAQPSRGHLALLAIGLAVAIWTHFFGWVLLLGSLGLWLWYGIRSPRLVPWRRVAVAYAAAIAAGLPLLLLLGSRLESGVRTFDRTGLHAGLLSKPAYLMFTLAAGPTSYPWNPPTLAALSVFLAGLFLVLARRGTSLRRPLRDLANSSAVVVWIPVVAMTTLVVTDYSAPHYYLVVLAGVALLAGWLAEQGLAARISLVGYAAAAVIGVVHLERGQQFQREEYLDPWRDVVAKVRASAEPGDRVLVSHPSAAFYAGVDPRFVLLTRPGELPRVFAGSGPDSLRTILALVTPLSGAVPELTAFEHWLGDSLEARGYRVVRDSGLVACDAPEARRRFSGRPFPDWRVRLLEWKR